MNQLNHLTPSNSDFSVAASTRPVPLQNPLPELRRAPELRLLAPLGFCCSEETKVGVRIGNRRRGLLPGYFYLGEFLPGVLLHHDDVTSVGFDGGVNLPAFADFGFGGVDDDHAAFVGLVFHDLDFHG